MLALQAIIYCFYACVCRDLDTPGPPVSASMPHRSEVARMHVNYFFSRMLQGAKKSLVSTDIKRETNVSKILGYHCAQKEMEADCLADAAAHRRHHAEEKLESLFKMNTRKQVYKI